MRLVGAGLMGLVLAVAACGQIEPVLMTVSMPDCTYQGADEMQEGRARLSLTLNGIGEWGTALLRLEDDHTFDDFTETANENAELAAVPSWARSVIELRLSDEEGRDGVDSERVLDEGTYAVICIYVPDEGAATYVPLEEVRVDAR